MKSAKLLIASSDKNMNMYYATRFMSNDAFIFAEIDDEGYMITNDMEIGRAQKTARVDHVLSSSRYEDKIPSDTSSRFIELLHLFLQEYQVSTLHVQKDFSLYFAKELEKKGYIIEILNTPLFPQREIKTSEEIRFITEAQQANDKAMERVAYILEQAEIQGETIWWDGQVVTSELLRKEIGLELYKLGCLGLHTIVSAGEQGADPHETGHGIIKPHQTIIVDIFPRSLTNLYWADMTRTFVKGSASDTVKELYNAVLEAQLAALNKLTPGVKGDEVHQAVLDTFSKYGYKTGPVNGRIQGFFHGTGHGVGLDIHEAPALTRDAGELKPGHVVTVEPGLYYHEIGSVRLEDIVVITENGFNNLTQFPKYLEIP